MFVILRDDWTPINYSVLKFSGGEVHVRLGEPDKVAATKEYIMIQASLHTSDLLMELLLVVDAIRRAHPTVRLQLKLPYVPYGRQDRVCAPGEALSVSVFANLINAMEFDKVMIWDPHSDVTPALINNCLVEHQASMVQAIVDRFDLDNLVLVAPDAGASKKVIEVAKKTGFPFVRADKERNPANGEITGTIVHSEHIGDKHFLMVDDICDGGRTFIELAKVLRPLTRGQILLYVTNGIFSKGLSVFDGLIDHIYAAFAFPGADRSNPLLTVTSEDRR